MVLCQVQRGAVESHWGSAEGACRIFCKMDIELFFRLLLLILLWN